ncbi:MAG: pyridoxine 5'-phosphate synthase [Candidatus Omnitrophica bacterium]|nr:pyridoxine 5'-phosphate synthase [Candidatus Omnitrophota bacterium]
MKLGINIDHVATLRQSRQIHYPDPVVAALLSEHAGCDSIVAHLREDRRHINQRDVELLNVVLGIPFNLEMSINKQIVAIAMKVRPEKVTLVPEKRKELTTEGGLNLTLHYRRVKTAIEKLASRDIEVSLFIDPVRSQIDKAKSLGVRTIELNTGKYSESKTVGTQKRELEKIKKAVQYAHNKGFFVAVGHGLEYENVRPLTKIKGIQEFNIGHAIVSRSVFVGIVEAAREMISLIDPQRKIKKRNISILYDK